MVFFLLIVDWISYKGLVLFKLVYIAKLFCI